MTKRRSATSAVATSTQFQAKDVPGMMAFLDSKLEGFKHITESAYQTGGVIEGVGDIKTITDLPSLIKAAGALLNSESIYNNGAKSLGLKQFPQYMHKGHTTKTWLEDIKLRYDIINQKETVDQLNEFKKGLEQFMTEDDKKAAFMNKMAEFFQNNK